MTDIKEYILLLVFLLMSRGMKHTKKKRNPLTGLHRQRTRERLQRPLSGKSNSQDVVINKYTLTYSYLLVCNKRPSGKIAQYNEVLGLLRVNYSIISLRALIYFNRSPKCDFAIEEPDIQPRVDPNTRRRFIILVSRHDVVVVYVAAEKGQIALSNKCILIFEVTNLASYVVLFFRYTE